MDSLIPSPQERPMKIIGTIRPNTTQEIEAEGADYPDAREKMMDSIPEGYTLLHVRRDD